MATCVINQNGRQTLSYNIDDGDNNNNDNDNGNYHVDDDKDNDDNTKHLLRECPFSQVAWKNLNSILEEKKLDLDSYLFENF
jgi:hypothetical protein